MSLGPDPHLQAHQQQQLTRLEELLRSSGVDRGMIARGDVVRLRGRHVEDSLRGAAALGPEVRRVADLGSGGGLPGAVLAVARPDLTFVLAERRANRVDFLGLVVRELALENVLIHAGDVADLPHGAFDACTARAFGKPLRSWRSAEPLLAPGGYLLYWAGRSFDVRADGPPDASVAVFGPAAVAGSGPLVIMSRQ